MLGEKELFSIYKQVCCPHCLSFYRGTAYIKLASWIRPTSKQGCHDVVVCDRLLLQEHIVLVAGNVHTSGAYGDTVC